MLDPSTTLYCLTYALLCPTGRIIRFACLTGLIATIVICKTNCFYGTSAGADEEVDEAMALTRQHSQQPHDRARLEMDFFSLNQAMQIDVRTFTSQMAGVSSHRDSRRLNIIEKCQQPTSDPQRHETRVLVCA